MLKKFNFEPKQKTKVDVKKAALTDEQIKRYVDEISKISGISIGARIYNLFVKMKVSYNGGVENWKKFENEVAKMLLSSVDIDPSGIPPEFLNFQTVVDVFYSSAVMAGAMSRIAQNPEKAKEIIDQMGEVIPALLAGKKEPEKVQTEEQPTETKPE